jgi:hypothetical protein
MARTRDGVLPPDSQLGLYLDRYAELLGLNLCAFNGINRSTEGHDSQCTDIWSQTQRDFLARYLLQAEEKREEILQFHVGPKWKHDTMDMQWGNPFILERKYLLKVGFPTSSSIQAGVVLNLGPAGAPIDPVVFTVTSADATVDEVVVTYPGELVRIFPTYVSKTGNVITITIPRCRLVKTMYCEDFDDPPLYIDNNVFLATVDVYRVYADVSKGAEFLWVDTGCTPTNCTPICQPACPMIVGTKAYELSMVHLYPATYSSGSWARTCWSQNSYPKFVRVSYLSGRQTIDNEVNTIRLAHTLMPRAPCECDIVNGKWAEDNEPSKQWSQYGSKTGAVEVWMADSLAKVTSGGGMFPRMGPGG